LAEALLGPYLVAAAALIVGGLAKLRAPLPLAKALTAAGVGGGPQVPRVLGLVEIAIGFACIAHPSPVTAVLLAAMYVLFAAFLGAALLLKLPIESCGCLGDRRAPPNWPHVGLNLAAAATGMLAVPIAVPSFGHAVLSLGPAAPVFLVGAIALGYAAYLAVAHLSDLAHVYGSTELRVGPSPRP
jgi:hypothetical protein